MAISLEKNLLCLINRGNVSIFFQSQSVNQRSVWSYGGPLCENSVQCTEYNIQFTQYNVQCIVQGVHCRGNTVQFNIHYKLGTVVFFLLFPLIPLTVSITLHCVIVHSIVYRGVVHCALYDTHFTLNALHLAMQNIHLKCTLQLSVYFTLNNVQCGFYNLHCTFCSIQYTL